MKANQELKRSNHVLDLAGRIPLCVGPCNQPQREWKAMGKRVLRLCVLSATLALGMLLSACGQPSGSGREDVVAFDALIASPRQYAGRYVCTEGIDVSGFESSGLAAAVQEGGSHPELTEPVIWLEGADVQSRQDCIRTDTNPSFEFCQAVVCGVFNSGGAMWL